MNISKLKQPQPIPLHPASEAWQEESLQNKEAEEEYCSAIVADPYAIIMTKDAVAPKEFFYPKTRAIVEAAWACLEQEPPLTVTRATIKDRLQEMGQWESVISPAYLRQLDDAGTQTIVKAAIDNAGIVRTHARARRVRDAGLLLAQRVEEKPWETDGITEKAARHMLEVLAQTGINKRDPSAKAIMADIDEDGIPFRPTGLNWLDRLLKGGHRRAQMYAILGQYKGRKTTFARSLVLKELLDGVGISWFVLDGTRQQVVNGFIAMLATHQLREWGVPESQYTLGSLGIPKSLRTAEQHEAIMKAQGMIGELHLRVYDGKDGVKDVDVLEAHLRRDILMYGTEVFVADFIQRFYVPDRRVKPGTEQYEAVTERFATLTVREGLTSVVISQQNEEKNKNTGSSTAGAKGGAALPAAADFVIKTEYDSKEDKGTINVSLDYSRYSEEGDIQYKIEPNSGLIWNMAALH